jgi:hypothetical protein
MIRRYGWFRQFRMKQMPQLQEILTELQTIKSTSPVHVLIQNYHQFFCSRYATIHEEGEIRCQFHGTVLLHVCVMFGGRKQPQQSRVHLMEDGLCFVRQLSLPLHAVGGPEALPEGCAGHQGHQQISRS